VKVKGDGVTENNEFFNVIVDGAKYPDTVVGGVTIPGDAIPMGTATAKGTINDNDTTVLTIGDATVVEGDSGQKNAVFLVTLTPSSGRLRDGEFYDERRNRDSKPGLHHQERHAHICPGVTSQFITVPILGDLGVRGNRELHREAKQPIFRNQHRQRHRHGDDPDNDPVPTVSVGPASVYEGNPGDSAKLAFEVKLTNPSSKAVTVRVVTADGTAVAGTRLYRARHARPDPASGEFLPYQEITFRAGETTKTVFVNVTGDADNEADETMSLQLVQVADPPAPLSRRPPRPASGRSETMRLR
jgi:hypothetical protein